MSAAINPEIVDHAGRPEIAEARVHPPVTIDVKAEISIVEARQIVDARQRWAKAINATFARSLQAAIEVGDMLAQAKLELRYGQFEEMLTEDLHMSPATSRKLRAIAESSLIRSRANDLPPSWDTVYQLTTLPEPDLALALEKGLVSCRFQRKDMPQLKVRLHMLKTGRHPKRTGSERRSVQRSTSPWDLIQNWMGPTRIQAFEAADRDLRAEFLREVQALADKFFGLEDGKIPSPPSEADR